MKAILIIFLGFNSLNIFSQDNLLFGTWGASGCSFEVQDESFKSDYYYQVFKNARSVKFSDRESYVEIAQATGAATSTSVVAKMYYQNYSSGDLSVDVGSDVPFSQRSFPYSYYVDNGVTDYRYRVFFNVRSSGVSAQFFVQVFSQNVFGFYTRKVGEVSCRSMSKT